MRTSPTWSMFTSWPVSSLILSFLLCDLTFPLLCTSLFLLIWFLALPACFSSLSALLLKVGVLSIGKFPLRAPRLHLCAAEKYISTLQLDRLVTFILPMCYCRPDCHLCYFPPHVAIWGHFHLCCIPQRRVGKVILTLTTSIYLLGVSENPILYINACVFSFIHSTIIYGELFI